MTHEEIKEGNTLIIEFMGGTHRTSERYGDVFRIPDKAGEYGEKAQPIHYHTSWDRLMPVIEKIEQIRINGRDEDLDVEWNFTININKWSVTLDRDVRPQYWGTDTDFLGLWDASQKIPKIEMAYNAVVTFIRWYNDHKK